MHALDTHIMQNSNAYIYTILVDSTASVAYKSICSVSHQALLVSVVLFAFVETLERNCASKLLPKSMSMQ